MGRERGDWIGLGNRARRFVDDPRSWAPTFGPPAYFLGLALLVFLPLLGDGYLLTLDMVFAPDTGYVDYLFRSTDPLYYGRLPFAALLDVASVVLPDWAIQRVVLVGIVAGSGLSMYRASRSETRIGALFAGTLYAINPFVYVRLLAGHWWLLLGYALLPMAVVSYADALAGRGRARRAAAWATAASLFDPHVAVLLAVAYACVGAAAMVRPPAEGDDGPGVDGSWAGGRRIVGRTGRVAVIAVALNAYWLLPAASTILAGRSKVAAMSGLDLVAFGASGTLGGNVPLSVATLLGFWRGGVRLPVDPLPLWPWLGLYAVLLLLAFVGWYDGREASLPNGLLLVGVVGFVLGLGASVDTTAPLFRWLYEHVVVFRGMRDSQKFVALLALAYAALGGRGVDRPVAWVDRALTSREGGSAAESRGRRTVPGTHVSMPDRRSVLRVALAVLLLATPLAYTWPALWGFSGQLSPTEYPDGWAEANDHLVEDQGQYRVLFLPWHQYLTFPWTGRRVANPADAYFERPVVRSRSIDLGGIDSQAASPTHGRVTALLEAPDNSGPLAGELADLGVKYVIVARAADYRRYDYLRASDDFRVAVENDDLVLYENRRFASAPPPDRWPPDSPVVPWGALTGGSVVSAVAAVVLLVPCSLRRSWRRHLGTLG